MKHKKMLSILSVALFAATSLFGAVTTGEKAPDFALKDQSGKTHNLSDFEGKYVVLEWTNKDCPFVVKHYKNSDMQNLQAKYAEKDVVWLTICSSAEGEQGYMSPEQIQEHMKSVDSKATAYLIDERGIVGKAYGATNTPHMYVINPQGALIYQGAIDSIRSAKPDDVSKADNYVIKALESAMNDRSIEKDTTKAYGCGIKYAKD